MFSIILFYIVIEIFNLTYIKLIYILNIYYINNNLNREEEEEEEEEGKNKINNFFLLI